jgi:hypothetical protein
MRRDGKDEKAEEAEVLATRLAKESQISEEQARELIKLIGTDWSSLIREARLLKSRH